MTNIRENFLLEGMLAGEYPESKCWKGVQAFWANNNDIAQSEFTAFAEAGDAEAQNNLGVMHAYVRIESADDRLAYMWLYLADQQGNEQAKGNLMIVRKFMGQTQINEAEAMARQCCKQGYKKCEQLLPQNPPIHKQRPYG